MELLRGFSLVKQQYTALMRKNLILSYRNKAATFLQLFSSIFFMFLLYCVDKADQFTHDNTTFKSDVKDPRVLVSPAIPACEKKVFGKTPCYDFVWSGNSSSRVNAIVSGIMRNNPDRPIPPHKVISFETKEDVDKWLYSNPMRCPGALHFKEINATIISYGIQTNSTPVYARGRFEDPTFKFQIPLQIAAERELARSLIGDESFSWVVGLKEFAHPAGDSFSAVSDIGPAFFLAFAMFGFVIQLGSLVAEKELKLRQAMSLTGLYDSSYWVSWITWEGIITLISSLFLVLFGLLFQFPFFKKNNFGIVFLVFFLFQLNLIGFAFLISTFLSKSSSATTVGFSIFIVGTITQLVTGTAEFRFPYTNETSRGVRYSWSLFPPNLLAAALAILGDATDTPQGVGISWSARTKCPSRFADLEKKHCPLTLNDIYIWHICLFLSWIVLAIYFDNIFPNASGVRRPLYYFLSPWYWTGKGGNKVKEGGIFGCFGSVPVQQLLPPDDEDVLEEEENVKQEAREDKVDSDVAVHIRGLFKTYPGAIKFGGHCCCSCKRTPPFHAVKGLWMRISKDQLFCLLGPNGAGKTTTISCLTGLTPVTGGDALIYGNSIRSSVGMSNIRRLIGVCPQFDILWDALTGREHLQLFARIKGLPAASISQVTVELLSKVKLLDAAGVRARSYSGGMKRRLSVALALLGDPKLVILDEPTTGMDPVTRRHVWDIIQDAKKGRAIILTTHSMEEADVLSDRIAIMAKGRLQCIGTSIRLKSKFGTGFITNVSFSETTNDQATQDENHESVKQFFKAKLDVMPTEETKSFMTYVIPHDKEKLLTEFFRELQDRQDEFGIADVQLGLTTLEEVFLNIAKQAELESATAEGRMTTLTLTSGTSVQIPIGARYVGIPGSESPENPRGIMVEVYWEQDERGTLCIYSHSAAMPLPPNVQLPSSEMPLNGSRTDTVHGIVIQPNQISNQ